MASLSTCCTHSQREILPKWPHSGVNTAVVYVAGGESWIFAFWSTRDQWKVSEYLGFIYEGAQAWNINIKNYLCRN